MINIRKISNRKHDVNMYFSYGISINQDMGK